jgi:predicted permease
MERPGIQRWLKLRNTEARDAEAEVDAELSTHVDARIEQLMAQGMSRADAVAEAERRLGGIAHARYRMVREAWERDRRLLLMDRLRDWRDDARYAARAVFRERGFALVVVVTLALGIGANATMFGIIDRLLLTGPAHVAAPEELHRFYITVQYEPDRNASTWAALHYPALQAFRERVPSVLHASGYLEDRRVLGSGVESRELVLGAVTASFFEMTGTRAVLGRFFTEAEDAGPGGEHVIVLGHELWQTLFGGRPDVVGETIELSGTPYTITGVAPPDYTGVGLTPVEGWTPLSISMARRLQQDWSTNWQSYMIPLVGRLAPGATPERAAAEATAAWRQLYESLDGRGSRMHGAVSAATVSLRGIRAGESGEEPLEARVSRWLVLVAAVVLLVACANVANLYVARALRRRREVAVRLSLGISRGRLVRMLLLESAVLAGAGGIAALAVAYWGAQVVRNVLLPDIHWSTSPLDVRVLGVALTLTLLVALVTGVAPTLQSLGTRLQPLLAGASHTHAAPGRIRSILAVMQAAFCVLLLVGAGLFVRSLQRVQGVDIGMEPGRVLQLQLQWQAQPQLDPAEVRGRRDVFLAEALERLIRVPGVEAAAAAIGSPFHGAYGGSFRPENAGEERSLPGGAYISAVTPDYFSTLGTPLLRGRSFVAGEGAGTERVVILSRSTAELLWPGEDPIDRCVYATNSNECTRVVGVVADARRFRIEEDPGEQFYVPIGQQAAWMQGPALLVRSTGDAARLAEPVRRALFELDPTLRHVATRTYVDRLDPQWRPWKLGALLFAFCGILALVIAAIGLYSVIAYMVLHRRHEIGVRMALGAERRDIVTLIVRQTLLLAACGIAIGLGIAVLAAPLLEPLLYETAPRDAVVLAIVALTLMHAALAAGVGPALRASRVPPTQVLRDA